MRWFAKKSPITSLRRDDPPLADLLDRLARLTEAEANTVEDAVARNGLGVTDESADTIAIMLSTALTAQREPVRALAQQAGQEAAAASSPGRPAVIYAAGVLAETFAIRGLLDAKTWNYLTDAWNQVFDLPRFGEERVGAASVVGERVRQEIERRAREMDQDVSWLVALRDRASDPALTAAIMGAGLSRTDAERILSIVRREIEERIHAGRPVAAISTRRLCDLADACRGHAMDEWDGVLASLLDAADDEADELNALMYGPYDAARASLVTYLFGRRPTMPARLGLSPVQGEVLPGLYAQLVLHGSNGRTRLVADRMLDAWGVAQEEAWAHASDNVVAAPIESEPWPDPASPIRRVWSEQFEAEFLGLLAHRLPDACAAGHIVGLPFRGSALILRMDAASPIQAVPAFASLAANSYREAATFDDELYPNLIWLRPDGNPVLLCSIFEPPLDPSDLPPDFLQAAARTAVREGRA